jgi:hypothetical protein
MLFSHVFLQISGFVNKNVYLLLQVWVIGKWATPNDQKWAPPGTHFHQFVVPNIIESRQDCTYGKLAAMHLPKEIKGLRSCEVLVLNTFNLQIFIDEGIVGAK